MKKLLTIALPALMATVAYAETPVTAAPVAMTASSSAAAAPQMRGEITKAVSYQGSADLITRPVAGLPTPSVTVSDVKQIKTVLIPANTAGSAMIDVTLIDEFIDNVAPNARHYPPNFPNRSAEYFTIENVKHLSDWLEPYATAPDASFDVVLRAAKINGMARNLNVGVDYTLRAGNHMQKIVKIQPNNAEANFLYGMMIAEAGGFKEGRVYLDKAAKLGYVEAEQSIAQADLLSDNKAAALKRLRDLAAKHPENAQIAEQVRIVDNGGFYIWRIANNNISVKPIR